MALADWSNLYTPASLPSSTSFAKTFAKKLNVPILAAYQPSATSLDPAANTIASVFPTQWEIPQTGVDTGTGSRNASAPDSTYLQGLLQQFAPLSPNELLDYQSQAYRRANELALGYGPQYSAQAYQNKLNDAALALSYQQSSPMDRQAIAQSIQGQVGTAQQGTALLNQSLAQMQQASKPQGFRGTTFQVG
jgi:hypothetical protein